MFRALFAAVTLAAVLVVVSYLAKRPETPVVAIGLPAPAAGGAAPRVGESAPPAPPAPAPGETVVTIDEATLNQQLARAITTLPITADTPLGTATLRTVAVQLRGGRFQLSGSAQVGPATLPLAMVGTVEAQNGRPVARLASATIGAVPLPRAALQTFDDAVQRQVDLLLASQPVHVRSVAIDNGRLTLIGTPG